MLGAWEVVLGIMTVLVFAFPLRHIFIKHYIVIIGFGLGFLVGRILYTFISGFLGFQSLFVEVVVILVFGTLFHDAFREFIQKVFPK